MKSFTLLKTITLMVLIGALAYAAPVRADDVALSGSNSFQGAINVAMPITDLVITGTDPDPVPVKLRVTSGTLNLGTTTGLSFTGGTSGSTLYFTGSIANVNAALATLTYTRGGAGSDTLEVSLVNPGEVFYEGTGHLYEYISDAGDWNAALTKAGLLSRYGAQGYLATITSSGENAFVTARLANAGWMGASDNAVEGTWRWVTGPENGTAFWQGTSSGGTVGGNYANWGTGEPNNAGDEDCAQFLTGGTGRWNDLPCSGTSLPGYVAEFGATGDMPEVAAKNIAITTVSDVTPPTVDVLTPTHNATNVARGANLTIEFSEPVVVGTGNIEIRRVSDGGIEHTFNVAVGMVSGTGTDTITINPGTDLGNATQYYVIVPATAFDDAAGNSFAGITANTGWRFTTADTEGPVIVSVSPTDNATNVARGANLVITFDEPVYVGSGKITVTRAATGNMFKEIAVSAARITGYGTNVLTIDVEAPFESLTQHAVLIDAGAFQDAVGNDFLGISSPTVWNFEGEYTEPTRGMTAGGTIPDTGWGTMVTNQGVSIPLVPGVTIIDVTPTPAPVNQTSIARPTLRRGDRNAFVREAQELLNKVRTSAITVDGIFGRETDTAVRAFQTSRGLQVDGIVGPITWRELLK